MSEAMDAKFLDRLEELLDGKNVAEVCRDAMISRTYLDQIRRGDRRKLSYSVVRRLAAALGVRTAYLGEGLVTEEERVDTLAALHAWDVRMANERRRFLERIMAREREDMRHSLEAEVTSAIRRADAEAAASGSTPTHAGTAA